MIAGTEDEIESKRASVVVSTRSVAGSSMYFLLKASATRLFLPVCNEFQN
jgi:hypothetical protein